MGPLIAPAYLPPHWTHCAWCVHFHQARSAHRLTNGVRWTHCPHAETAQATRDGTCSHGLCCWCQPLLRAEWGIPPHVALPRPLGQGRRPAA